MEVKYEECEAPVQDSRHSTGRNHRAHVAHTFRCPFRTGIIYVTDRLQRWPKQARHTVIGAESSVGQLIGIVAVKAGGVIDKLSEH